MSHSKHIIRKSVIVGLSFAVGVVSTVFAAATYDANIQNRANTLFATIKSNASKMDPSTVPSYYTLVRTNIASLIQVLTTLDSSIAGELGVLSLPGLDDGGLLGQITGTGNSGTGNTVVNSQNTGNQNAGTGYYIRNTTDGGLGCKTPGLVDPYNKCILQVNDMFVAPLATEVIAKMPNGSICDSTGACGICKNMNIAGKTWHLPTMNELLVIRANKDKLEQVKLNGYWTSDFSRFLTPDNAFWKVGNIQNDNQTEFSHTVSFNTLCVSSNVVLPTTPVNSDPSTGNTPASGGNTTSTTSPVSSTNTTPPPPANNGPKAVGPHEVRVCGNANQSEFDSSSIIDPVQEGVIKLSDKVGPYKNNYEFNGKLLCNIGAEARFTNTNASGDPLGSKIGPDGVFQYYCQVSNAYFQELGGNGGGAFGPADTQSEKCSIKKKSLFTYNDATGILYSKQQNLSYALKHTDNYPGVQKFISSPSELPAYCASLRDGGYSDWRLPSNIEVRGLNTFLSQEPKVSRSGGFGRANESDIIYDFLDREAQRKYGFQHMDGTSATDKQDVGLYPLNLVIAQSIKWVVTDAYADPNLNVGYVKGLTTIPPIFTTGQVEQLIAKNTFWIGSSYNTAIVCVR